MYVCTIYVFHYYRNYTSLWLASVANADGNDDDDIDDNDDDDDDNDDLSAVFLAVGITFVLTLIISVLLTLLIVYMAFKIKNKPVKDENAVTLTLWVQYSRKNILY